MTITQAKRTFALLMQASQERRLTRDEKLLLTESRQALRMGKRSVMNPKTAWFCKKCGKLRAMNPGQKVCAKCSKPRGRLAFAYRGYSVDTTLTGEIFITKDGFHIGYAKSETDAKRIIDELTNENPKKSRNPRAAGVKIYGRILRIEAQKTQPHRCDAGCKRANHRYFHNFKSGAVILGMPDGSIRIKPK